MHYEGSALSMFAKEKKLGKFTYLWAKKWPWPPFSLVLLKFVKLTLHNTRHQKRLEFKIWHSGKELRSSEFSLSFLIKLFCVTEKYREIAIMRSVK